VGLWPVWHQDARGGSTARRHGKRADEPRAASPQTGVACAARLPSLSRVPVAVGVDQGVSCIFVQRPQSREPVRVNLYVR